MDIQKALDMISSIFSSDDIPVSAKIELWEKDKSVLIGKGAPQFTIKFKDPKAFDAILTDPGLGFGENYMKGLIEVEGDLDALLKLFYFYDLSGKLSVKQKAKIGWINIKQKFGHGLKQTKKNVQYHYDKGNEFYKLWLDKGLNYSCAFFKTEEDDLETAQLNKIHHILNKLRLKSGQKLLDIGCGWGSLVIEAAKKYGVLAVGLTLSKQQYELANERIREQGLQGRVEVRLEDYRETSQKEKGIYDRIVSVGMFEHVGRENIPIFFEETKKLLRNKGIMVLHTIGRMQPEELDSWLKKYIFPGGYIPALGEVVEAADKYGFDFVDLEDFRIHYAKTLSHWIKRFENNKNKIKEMMGEEFVRMWRLYLYGSRASFSYGPMHVFQFLYSLGRRYDWPLYRKWFYKSN